MKMINGLVVVVLMLVVNSHEEKVPVIETQLGLIVGYHKHSYDGRLFSAFEGIPFAQPPIGNLRFQEPQPITPWLGNWIATKTYTCIQEQPTGTIGDEDCLYLNVYVPKPQPTADDNFDVVVHIHGGGYMVGDSKLAGPEFLMDRDIVYVNLHYRLGVMGFLSTEDEIVKGNMGLKDQVMALKWVQNNIKQFGGNPLSVTLTGISAGAASTHFHYFSPKSKDLFHRGMSQSGTATSPWSIQKAPLKNTKILASSIGCVFASTKKIIDCLRQRPANQLVSNTHSLLVMPFVPLIPLAPVIEKKSESAFLTDYPYKLLQSGDVNDVPWITSVTTDEGILAAICYYKEFDYINKNWNSIAPLLLEYDYTCPDELKNNISEKIKSYYFDNEPLSAASIPKLVKLFTDRFFTLDMQRSAEMQANVSKSHIYSYIYGYQDERINDNEQTGLDKNYGVNHGADGNLLYSVEFLGRNMSSQNLTKSDEIIKNLLVDIIVTFAKTGKPVIENTAWYPINHLNSFGYLFIKNPNNTVMTYKDEIAPKDFWKSLQLKEDEHYEIF